MLRLEAAVPETVFGMAALAKVALAGDADTNHDTWDRNTGSRIGHRILFALAGQRDA